MFAILIQFGAAYDCSYSIQQSAHGKISSKTFLFFTPKKYSRFPAHVYHLSTISTEFGGTYDWGLTSVRPVQWWHCKYFRWSKYEILLNYFAKPFKCSSTWEICKYSMPSWFNLVRHVNIFYPMSALRQFISLFFCRENYVNEVIADRLHQRAQIDV